MGKQVSTQKKRLAEEEDETEIVREDYVKKMKDSYPLIIRTLMHDLIVSVDKDGDFVFLNDAATEFWGKPSEEIIGTHFSNYLHPEDRKRTQLALQEIVKSKDQVKDLIVRVKSSRGTRTIAWNAVAVFDDEGKYVGTQATGKDLTDFLRTEEELKWSQRHFQRLFEVLVDPVVIVDMKGNILELSQSAEKILGFTREELVGKHFTETTAVTDKSKDLLTKNLRKRKNGKYFTPYTIEAVTKEGKKLLYSATTANLIYKGEPAILGIFHNITEQKKTEEKLRASEKRFNYFIENAPEAIWVQDINGIFLDGNKRAEKLTGYKKEELLGKNMLDILVSPESVSRLLETFKPGRPGEKSGPNEVELIQKDGSVAPIEASIIPVEREGKIEIIGVARDITERKRAEKEVIRLSSAVRISNDSIVISDLDGTILDVNEASLKMYGSNNKSDLIRANAFDLIVPEEQEKAFAGMKELLEMGYLPNREYTVATKDGNRIPVEMSTAIMKDADGKPIGFVSISRDITERKRAEEALQESEKRFRELNDLLPEIVFETDATGRITFVNQIAFERFGYTQEDLDKGLKAFQMLIPEDRGRAEDDMDRVLSGADPGFTEYTGLRKDGSTFPIMIHPTPIIRGNMPMGLRGIIVDITERKKMENVLKENEEKYRTVFEGATDGIAALDPKTMKVIFTNPKMTEITGYPLDELVNATIIDFIPKNELSLIIQQFQNHVEGKRDLSRYIPVVRKDKTKIYCDVRSKFLNIGNQQYLMAFVRDVTEQKKAEEALKESEKRFRELSELLPEIVFETDATGEITFVNKAALDSTGYSREDFDKGLNALQLVVAEDRDNVKKSIGELLSGKKIGPNEYTAVRKDGSTFPIIIHSTSIIRGNMPMGLRGIIVDITERKKTENELKESEERFRTIFEGATDGILAADPKTFKFVFTNPRMQEISGYPSGELINLTITNLVRKEDVPLAIDQFKKQLEGKATSTRNMPILRKDKSIVYCDISSRLLKIGNEHYLVGFFRDVTEQKKAVEALRQSEKKYREMINAMNDTALVLDFDTNIIDVNQTAVDVLGYSRKELLSMKVEQLDAGLTSEDIKGLAEKMKTSGLLVFETAHTTKGGRTFPVEISASRVTYYGKPAILSIARDITERKRVEKELIRLSNAVRMSNDSIVITDLDGVVVDVNDATLKMYGTDNKKELIGTSSFDLIVPEEREEVLADMKEVLKKGYIQNQEYTVTVKNGSEIPVEMSTAIMKDANGKPIGFVTISRDITERKKAEEALRSSEEAARRLLEFQNKIIDTATVWVNLIDLKGNVILWNRAAELVSGYSRKEIIGNNKMWELLYPDPDYRAKIFSIGKEISEQGRRIEDFYSTIRCKDGSLKTISWYATNILDEKGEPAGSLSIGVDVTEREKAQQAINNALALLRRSNMELESYTYVVSHDLKAPLRTIRSFGTFLLEDYEDKLDETGKDYLHRMINASSHLNTMIEDLLVLSRVGRKFTELEKVDLNQLLKEILTDLEATIKEHKTKIVVDKLPVLSAQKVWMRQLFTNLISNALKFNESKTPKIEVLYEERENDQLFKVRDNGIGIERKYLERIFKLFERAPTEKRYDGTGAGLAICKKIVEHLGGKIWVESTPGKGSTFFFTIPKKELKSTKET